MGVNFGVVDCMRTTLDTGPRWEEPDPFALRGSGGNFKSSVKSAARRYYLHGRVWENHDDLLFFRTDASQPEPAVTLQEATTLASSSGTLTLGFDVDRGSDATVPFEYRFRVVTVALTPASAGPVELTLVFR